jgi:hypothetical protein
MKYVLMLLFFTTPPAPHLDVAARKANASWTFQNSSTMEFENLGACEANAQIVIEALDNVDTMTATGWCFCKNAPGTECTDDIKSSQKLPGQTNKSIMLTLPTPTGAPPRQMSQPVRQFVSKKLERYAK